MNFKSILQVHAKAMKIYNLRNSWDLFILKLLSNLFFKNIKHRIDFLTAQWVDVVDQIYFVFLLISF